MGFKRAMKEKCRAYRCAILQASGGITPRKGDMFAANSAKSAPRLGCVCRKCANVERQRRRQGNYCNRNIVDALKKYLIIDI